MLSLPLEEQYLVVVGTDLLPRSARSTSCAACSSTSRPPSLDPDARPDLHGRGAASRQGRRRCSRRRVHDDAAEAGLIRRLVATVTARRSRRDREPQPARLRPAVPRAARAHASACRSGSAASPSLGARAARVATSRATQIRVRVPGPRVHRHARRGPPLRLRDRASCPATGLKAVARHFGIAPPERELIRGDQIARGLPHRSRARPPLRHRRRRSRSPALARLLGGAAYALAQMAPRRYERLADAGAATGVIDPLLVRAYLRAGHALPAHEPGDGTSHAAPRCTCSRPASRTRGQGRRREPLPVADAHLSHRPGAATVSARCSRWSIGWSSGGSRPRRPRARDAARIGRSASRTRRCRRR